MKLESQELTPEQKQFAAAVAICLVKSFLQRTENCPAQSRDANEETVFGE